jgi:UDP-glucuronate decarboxylase
VDISDPVVKFDVQHYLDSGGTGFGNCAILGASGMLSSYLLDFISSVNLNCGEKSKVFGFSRSKSLYIKNLSQRPNVEIYSLIQLEQLLNMEEINVIHAASPSSLTNLVNDTHSLIESNVKITSLAQSYLKKTGGRFTFFSSGEVYGHSATIPTKESDYSPYDHLDIKGFYPEVKKYVELISKMWFEDTNLPVTILRIFHTFGPGIRNNDTRIFSSAIYSMLEKNEINLNSSGLATRTFLYSSDLASAISLSSKKEGFEVFNVGGQDEMKIIDFANLVATYSDNCVVRSIESPSHQLQSNSNILRGYPNIDKLKSIGWEPTVPIAEAINRTIRSVQWRTLNQLS